MGYRITKPHVRVRTNIRREWIWELLTHDGHVASVSRCYQDRDSCESEARSHGLPVIGGRKQTSGRQKLRQAGLRVYANSRGLWLWEQVGEGGNLLAESQVAFLSKAECERAAALCLGMAVPAGSPA